MVIGMILVVVFMVLGNLIWVLVIGGVFFVIVWFIVCSDYNMFKIIFLFGCIKVLVLNKMIWGGLSYFLFLVVGV